MTCYSLKIHNFYICFLPFPVEKISVANCEGSTKYGPYIFIDFHKINRPCSCTVTTSFIGDLLVISMEVINRQCNTHVIVQNTFIFGCPIQASSSVNLGVEINQPVSVQSKNSAPSTLGIFYHCLGFQQNGMLDQLSFFLLISGFCVDLYNHNDLFIYVIIT